MKNVLIQKNKKYMNFEFILEFNLIILMWWQYFLFSEWMLEQCIFLILLFMNVKIVGKIMSSGASLIISVSITPGAMQFTVIFRLANSTASAFVAPMIPALEAL